MTREPTRVVLVKPGDVLIIGGLDLPEDPDVRDSFLRSVDALKNIIGVRQIVVCEDDVSIAAETPARQVIKPLADIIGAESAQVIEEAMARQTGQEMCADLDKGLAEWLPAVAEGALSVENARLAILERVANPKRTVRS